MPQRHTHGDITYSYGQQQDRAEKPVVHGAELWQIHFWYSDGRRFTWDVSDGQPIACGDEIYRSHSGRYVWMRTDMPVEGLPPTL